jgi:hypothetical protein
MQGKPRLVMAVAAVTMVVILVAVDRFQQRDDATEAGAAGATPAAPTGTPASVTPTPREERSPVVPATTAVPSSTPSATPSTEPNGEHKEPATGPVVAAASSYLRVFFDKRLTDTQWRKALAALSTASHAATLAQVPRSAVPAAAPGTATITRLGSSTATVRAVLSTDDILDVGLVLDVTGWKVSRVVPYSPVVTR